MKLLFTIFLAIMAKVTPLQSFEPCHITEATRLVINEYSKLTMRMGLNVLGYGGSCPEKIEQLEIIVEIPWKLTLPQARMVFITLLAEWMEEVNDDNKARPYYSNDPMTPENFEMRILFGNYDVSSSESEPQVAFIFNLGDKVVYCYRNVNTGRLTPFLRENYYQALDTAKTYLQEQGY